ncbi:MAG: M48 family metallopeptidase [Planctomycetota bacterium]|jgi:STE24 endopeptidase
METEEIKHKDNRDIAETPTKAKQYSSRKTQLTIIQLIVTTAFLLVMHLLGGSLALKDIATRLSGNFYLQAGIYLSIFACIYYLLFLGLDFYSGFLLEHKFSLSNQTLLGWFKKTVKKAILSLLIFLIVGELLYFFLKIAPNNWWILATGAWILLTIVLGKIAPVLIIPLFYKCTPIAESDLKERLLQLSKKCGLSIKQVFEIQLSKETQKANAAVAGMGKDRRILIGDTLLKNYSDEEIEAIFAHELAHIRLGHIWKIVTFGVAISLASFYLTSLLFKTVATFFGFAEIFDIAAFPLLALILFLIGLMLLPSQLAFLRHLETQADKFAISHIQNKESFHSAMTKLGNQNLSDPNPGRLEVILLYDHPPISKRLRLASGEKSQ